MRSAQPSTGRKGPLPSPGSSVSPAKGGIKHLPTRRHLTDSPEEDEEEYASGDEGVKSKLEIRREKNRVKQRNLRLRRANQMESLENENSSLRSEIATLKTSISQLQQRESNLLSWIKDLETTLHNHQLSKDVVSLRRIYGQGPTPRSSDPLATLANAAMTAAQPSRPPSSQGARSVRSEMYQPPLVPWDQMIGPSSWPGQLGFGIEDRKRKREDSLYMEKRYRQDTLAPINPNYRPPSVPIDHSRPSTAPHHPSVSSIPSTYNPNTVSPRSHDRLAVSNLLSPVNVEEPNVRPTYWRSESSLHQDESSVQSERRWSVGELSVIDNSLSILDHGNMSGQERDSLSGAIFPDYYTTLPTNFTRGIHQTFPQIENFAIQPAPSYRSNLEVDVQRRDSHPAILACRSLLLSLLPKPLPNPLPPLPPLEPAHQKLLLLALTALVPVQDQPMFHQRQLKFIPAEDAKRLLQYQSDPSSDPRLVLFPIAIMRAKIVQCIMDNRPVDVTEFINHTLSDARIYGATLDPDAWEMSLEYWSKWEEWIPRGRAYCHSLSKWRRRDGHLGSTVVEMILGLEREGRRRSDPVGKPPNWTF